MDFYCLMANDSSLKIRGGKFGSNKIIGDASGKDIEDLRGVKGRAGILTVLVGLKTLPQM